MKKFLVAMMCAVLCGAAVLGAAACGGKGSGADGSKEYTVYAPDGAPALALANLLHGDSDTEAVAEDIADRGFTFKTTIVKANTVPSFVQGESPKADFCILPVNAAAKLLGSGETYKLLGTVTNGNMFFITAEGEALTADNLQSLVGKTVGVVQLNNVPGLTFQSVLKREAVPYAVLDGSPAADKVNLKPFEDATTVGPAAGCDYYLCPEPAVSAKTKSGALHVAGDLQEMYGGGYPQAVAVVKNSVIESAPSAVAAFLSALAGSEEYLQNATAAEVLDVLSGAYETGFEPTFKAANLTEEVIANCSVRFTPAAACKDKVNSFLDELIAVSPNFTSAVSDAFYYQGN